ncbi:hypothetical protein JW906_04440 [bacterium]|nr:hypothetical protein [bacterium]
MAFTESLVNGEKLTRENFTRPPAGLGILPFWFWNGEMKPGEMEWQLREYKSKGIPGLFIHGRFGLKVPYLSDAWMDRVRFAVEKAKEIGIDIWIYDEMNWPSGTAERAVPKRFPHLKQKYLELVVLDVDGPLFTFLEATDSRYVNTGDSKPIAAFGCTAEEWRSGIRTLIDLTPNLSFDKVIPWEAPPGKWKLLYFLEKEADYYIDALDPESTRRFIEATHEKYKAAVGEDFGGAVPGFYTDEPAMYYYQVGVDNHAIPWSNRMFKIFRDRRGYDLKPLLPALFADMGKDTARIRYDFWRTLTEQYSDSYYKAIRDWCDRNKVLFTGHLLLEEWLRIHARCEGNLFKHLKHLHIIGVDHLYPKIGSDKEPDQHVPLKIGSSAAHHFGSTRVLCESMGGSYWDCTLERMKWMANWEYALGVNLFNNHGYHYSVEGERKRDWPPSQFYQHPWWKYYEHFTLYAARLSHALSGGRHVAKILVLYPIHSIWTNYTPQQRNAVGDVIESEFNWMTDALLRLHFDFDYADEDILAGADVSGGRIRIADEQYELLILPPLTHIKQSAFEAIRKFVRGGGAVIADALLPHEMLEGRPGASASVEKLFGVKPESMMRHFERDSGFRVTQPAAKSRVFTVQGRGFGPGGRKDALDRLVRRCIVPDVTVGHEDVFYLHRIKDGLDLYFFANTTQKDLGFVEVSFEKSGAPELWDPATGRISPLFIRRMRSGRMTACLEFPPGGSHIVAIEAGPVPPSISRSNLTIESFDGSTVVGTGRISGADVFADIATGGGVRRSACRPRKNLKPIRLGRSFDFSIEGGNALCISGWKMALSDGSGLESAFMDPAFDDRAWLTVRNGAWEMQLPRERDAETYPVTLLYRTRFEVRDLPGKAGLLIDGFSGKPFRLFINGLECREAGRRSSLDAEILEIDIQPCLKAGWNTAAVMLTAAKRTDGILDLLKITGDFALEKTDGGHRIVRRDPKIRTGDWTQQGYPFFSGTGIYRTEIDIPEEYTSGRLFLEAECGEDVLEISLNGGRGLVLPWHPYRADITALVRPGRNILELKVTNTSIAILEGIQKPSGLLREPFLTHEHRYELAIREKGAK